MGYLALCAVYPIDDVSLATLVVSGAANRLSISDFAPRREPFFVVETAALRCDAANGTRTA